MYARTGALPPSTPTFRKNICCTRQVHAVRHADVTDHRAGPRNRERCLHRLAGADALERRVDADADGHLLHALDSLVAAASGTRTASPWPPSPSPLLG